MIPNNSRLIKSIFKNKKTLDQLRLNLKNVSIWEKVVKSWQKTTKKLSTLGSHSYGNQVTIFNNGDDTYESMWEAIRNAKESISLETYTIEMDEIGKKTLDLLTEAKNRGCKVRFVYDAIGSSRITDFDLFRLNILGAETYKFNPVSIFGRLPFVFRNHRKIMVVDNKIGFCGGMNISCKYASEKIGGSDYFRDTHVRIEGPAVLDLQRVFHHSVKDKRIVSPTGNTFDSYSPSHTAACPYSMTSLENLYNSVDHLQNHLYQRNMNDRIFQISPNTFIFNFKDQIISNNNPVLEIRSKVNENNIKQKSISSGGSGLIQHPISKFEDEFEDEDEDEETDYNDLDEDEDEDNQNNNINNQNNNGNNPIDNKSFVQIQEFNLFRNKKSIQKAMIMTLKNSKSHCYFTTPYFLPPKKLRDAMIEAAGRGIDVRILTAGKSDVPWVRMASRHIYNKFLSKFVKIYEFQGNRLHSKTVTIDGIYSSIGSYNLDPWSQRNLEVNLSFINSSVAKQIEDQFNQDLKESSEITLSTLNDRSLFNKLICYLAYQFSRIVRPASAFK